MKLMRRPDDSFDRRIRSLLEYNSKMAITYHSAPPGGCKICRSVQRRYLMTYRKMRLIKSQIMWKKQLWGLRSCRAPTLVTTTNFLAVLNLVNKAGVLDACISSISTTSHTV